MDRRSGLMQTLWLNRFGGADDLVVRQRPVPQPGAEEVLIAVKAVGLNAWDWDLVAGRSAFIRLEAPFAPRHRILGSDIVGEVVQTGAKVDAKWVGRTVVVENSGGGFGGLAQFATAPAMRLVAVPSSLDAAVAAALPQAGSLALEAVRDCAAVKMGDRVLVNGGGGGVGHFAIQLAKARGAVVTGLDRADKLDAMMALGADRAFGVPPYDFVAAGNAYDAIIEPVATRSPGDYLSVLTAEGVLALVGGRTGPLLRLALAGVLGKKGPKRLKLVAMQSAPVDLRELLDMVVRGELVPRIAPYSGLEGAREALRALGAGEIVGKAVVTLLP